MKIIDLQQGSALWHEHRRTHFNASDAPAMMGCSPYKTRSQLLQELHSGVEPEVSAERRALFDEGHRCEALARPVAERIIGDDLYPIVVAEGRLSASLDGATLDGDTLFEHKSLNDELRAVMVPGCTGAVLPPLYRVQMEQQLHCAKAKRVLFMASKWSADGTLVEERHCWYEPDMALRRQVLAGWQQFEADLAEFVPREAAAVVVAASAPSLPAVSVRMDGAIAVVSNLEPFGVALRDFVSRIPAKPSTDQEFADTEAACKALKRAEEALEVAEGQALASIGDVEAMRRMVADLRSVARTARLASEKMVKTRKDQIRHEEVQRGSAAMDAHVAKLNARFGGRAHIVAQRGDFAGVIRGLRSLDSLRNAIDTEIAAAKIEANEIADRISTNLMVIDDAGQDFAALFADSRTLALKDTDAVKAIVAQRVAEHKQREARRLEAERERIRAEEAARAQRNVEAPVGQPTVPGTPGPYASSAPQAAQGASSGAGKAAHAGTRAAVPPIQLIEPPAPPRPPYPNPTEADLADPLFEAVWQCIKTWDVNVPEFDGPGLYAGANGSHAMLIVRAVRGVLS